MLLYRVQHCINGTYYYMNRALINYAHKGIGGGGRYTYVCVFSQVRQKRNSAVNAHKNRKNLRNPPPQSLLREPNKSLRRVRYRSIMPFHSPGRSRCMPPRPFSNRSSKRTYARDLHGSCATPRSPATKYDSGTTTLPVSLKICSFSFFFSFSNESYNSYFERDLSFSLSIFSWITTPFLCLDQISYRVFT